MSSYSERTLIVLDNTGKLTTSIIGTLSLGVILVPTYIILGVQMPVEYIITGDIQNVKAGFDFIDNCKLTLDKIWQ